MAGSGVPQGDKVVNNIYKLMEKWVLGPIFAFLDMVANSFTTVFNHVQEKFVHYVLFIVLAILIFISLGSLEAMVATTITSTTPGIVTAITNNGSGLYMIAIDVDSDFDIVISVDGFTAGSTKRGDRVCVVHRRTRLTHIPLDPIVRECEHE